MSILGFPDSYKFPETVPRTAKYRMVADAVSPCYSSALAIAIKEAAADRDAN
jgi:site-specific DNA-cytosine methylase